MRAALNSSQIHLNGEEESIYQQMQLTAPRFTLLLGCSRNVLQFGGAEAWNAMAMPNPTGGM